MTYEKELLLLLPPSTPLSPSTHPFYILVIPTEFNEHNQQKIMLYKCLQKNNNNKNV